MQSLPAMAVNAGLATTARVSRPPYQGLRSSRKQPTVLEVHHLTYQRVGHELLDDLILLCQVCHGKMNHPDYRRYITPDRINKRALPLPGPRLTEPEPVPPEPLADGAGARAR